MNRRYSPDRHRIDRAAVEFDRYLRQLGTIPRAACDPATIIERERELGRTIPEELRMLYSWFDGVEVDSMPIASNGIRIWPMAELRFAAHDEAGAFEGSVVFADYLLSSLEYALHFETGVIVLLNGPQSCVVADDLADFLAKCASGDQAIYGRRAQ